MLEVVGHEHDGVGNGMWYRQRAFPCLCLCRQSCQSERAHDKRRGCMKSILEKAEQQRQETQRARSLARHVRALLAGQMTREQVQAWLEELQAQSERGIPFYRQPAQAVYESLLSLDERLGSELLIRDTDIRGYLRWLTDSDCFGAWDDDSLFVLKRDIEELASELGVETVRWWHNGLGWWTSIRFSSPASGRPYAVHSELDSPAQVGFLPLADGNHYDAIVDLFEVLAIDDADVSSINRNVDIAQLPRWMLVREDQLGIQHAVAQFRSYAKACAQLKSYESKIYRVVAG